MDKRLTQLVEKLRAALGDRLVSVVLYGSAAAGERHEHFSDFNVLCVLTQTTPSELGACEDIFRWWREQGSPSPLLLSEQELLGSTDCFPIEFMDMKRSHTLLYGRDLVTGLEVETTFYRARVELELRSKLLRLRQKAAGVLSQPDLLRRLLADSLSTFCTLFRHALALHGEQAPLAKRDALAAAGARFGFDAAPFHQLLDLREQRIQPRGLDPVAVFTSYLQGIAAVIDAVDQLEK